MAFTTRQNNSDRTKVTLAVALLQAAAIYGIVVGLTTVVTRTAPPIIQATDIPVTPRPTPTPTHTPTAAPTDIMTLPTPLPGPTFTNEPIQPTSVPTTIASSGPIGTSGPTAQPTKSAALKAIGPAARGRPGDWVTTNDYPSRDLREGNQGVVRVRLEVNAAGRTTNCTVTGSSGFPGLDAATCAKLVARARFDPATDENGARTAGSWSTSVRWAIPKD
jgi:protein TonB